MSRIAGWIFGNVGESLYCPHGHRIQASWMVLSEQIVHCTHRSSRHADKCPAMLWVLVARQGFVFVAEVTANDIRAMRDHRTIGETFDYLGAELVAYPVTKAHGGEAA